MLDKGDIYDLVCVGGGGVYGERQRKRNRLISFQYQGFTVSLLKYEKASWGKGAMTNFTLASII